jgi:aspartyl-tRNA(Asn)/glutamyl-tRNA(Gln) amidotransferase subunit B
MFCGCSTKFGAPPNSHVCPVCLGYPGALPVINAAAIRLTVMTGLMLGSTINRRSQFDRKSYFYPDMPKNYQISQYDQPFCLGGAVDIVVNGRAKRINLTRIHLEEDVGKNMHFAGSSGVDFNRAGIPLMEIVSEPDMESPDEALAFLQALKQALQYSEVSACDLEKGNIRCDVNCSLRPEGQATLGTKTEIKNLNTFKGVYHALACELSRQEDVLREGGVIRQDTRRWDIDTGSTYSMRSKEDAHDYRYFPDPDLVPVDLTEDQIAAWSKLIPEQPADRRARFVRQYGLPEYDAGVLTADKDVADYFEAAAGMSDNPKAVSNWIMTEMLRLLGEKGMGISGSCVTPAALAGLVQLADRRTINSTTAKQVFAILFDKGGDPAKIVAEYGWGQVSDTAMLAKLVDDAVSANAKSVADYRAGKTAAAKFLVGQVMKVSRGKADPEQVARMIESRLRAEG